MVPSAFKSIIRFSQLLRHAPPEQSHRAASRETARRLRGAIGMSCNGAYGSGGNDNVDEVVGKELADGHTKTRKPARPPKAR